jgi:hypothetical protein
VKEVGLLLLQPEAFTPPPPLQAPSKQQQQQQQQQLPIQSQTHFPPPFTTPSRVTQVRPFPPVPLQLSSDGGSGLQLRVAYVSATGFQGNTTTARFMQRIFSLHDPSRVTVICVARAGDDGTSERSFIKEGCRDWLQFEKHDLCGSRSSFLPCNIVTLCTYTALLWVSTPGKFTF